MAVLTLLALGVTTVASCAGGGEDRGAPATRPASVTDGGAPALADHDQRAEAFLQASAAAPEPTIGPLRWTAIAELARRGDGAAAARLATLSPDAFAESFRKLDGYEDTADFDLLYLLHLRLGHAERLPAAVIDAIDRRVLEFKYWYTDATPGVRDNRWYWSENHRIIFHTLELLAGELFAERTFVVPDGDGREMTGADHVRRATAAIDAWIDEKAAHGFSEWHSDVYYQKDLTPLLALVAHSGDERLVARATTAIDLLTFDMALHQVRANMGVTHGRSYAKDKLRATDQNTFGAIQVLLGTSDRPVAPDDAGAVFAATTVEAYQVPEVIAEVATSTGTFEDTEHMGVAIDPEEPLSDDPRRPDGLSYTDAAMVPFWWERGGLTPWQTVGLTMDTADRYELWDTELFEPFAPIAAATGGDRDRARELARSLAPMINIGLLSAVDTRTWRSDGVMLSAALDYRPGRFGHQYHAWQATLGEDAVVFTTLPGNEPRPSARWDDDDLYWTGGVQPRSAQSGPAAIHVYDPAYAPVGPGPLEAFGYLDYTHAYFPTEHFEEVREVPARGAPEGSGSWWVARVGERFVALWSQGPTQWRDHTGDGTPAGGLTRFDLVAPGGARNVWVVEVGHVGDPSEGPGRHRDFEAFVDAVSAAEVRVTDSPDRVPTVVYDSPGTGRMELGAQGELLVEGRPAGADAGLRFDNPFLRAEVGDTVYEITAGGQRLAIDLATGERTGGSTG